MGMYKNIQDILNVLWYDEELLRLLYYSPENPDTPDPLDPSLENILDKDELEQWDIRNDLIKLTPKESDLTELKSCKLFVYLGDGYANRTNPLYINQSIVFDVFCPADYENGDFRSSRVGDRLKEIFSNTYVTGVGKMDLTRHRVLSRYPNSFIGHQYVFETTEFKK